MIGSVHGCVSCPVVVKPWEPHPLPLPQHRHHAHSTPPQPSAPASSPYPFSQRSSSVHPWPHITTKDDCPDSDSHPRTSSPRPPEDDGQDFDRFLSKKQAVEGKDSPLFSHQFKREFGKPEWKEPPPQQYDTSDLDLTASNQSQNKQESCTSEQPLVQIQPDPINVIQPQDFTEIPSATVDKSYDTLDFTPRRLSCEIIEPHPAPAQSKDAAVHASQNIPKGVFKSRGTQTPPISVLTKTLKQDSLTQTIPPSEEEEAPKAQPRISKTKTPLQSAWKPDESPSLHQRTLGRRLPALPKPKSLKLKVQLTQIPPEPANLPQKPVVRKKSSGLKKRNRKDSLQWVTGEEEEIDRNRIGTPAWLRQLTIPTLPMPPLHGAASGSKRGSGSFSYEPSESGSANNIRITTTHFKMKSPSPAQKSFESVTNQSTESDWSPQLQNVAPEVDSLTTAAAAGDMVMVKKLLQNGVDVNATNSFGRTAIQVMIHDNPDLAEMLMKAGADPNTCDVGKKAASSTFRTIAHDVAASGYTDTLRCLLRHGADVNLQDRWGNTPLHLAAKAGHLPAVRLLRRGTSLHTPNQQGKTPISILEELTDPAVQQWVHMKKTNASRLQTLCVLAIRKELGVHGLRCWCRHAPDSAIQRQVLLQCRSPPPVPSASTHISARLSAGSRSQKPRGHITGGSQSLMAALTSRQLLDFLTLRDLMPRRLSSGENTSLEVQNNSSVQSSDDVLSVGPYTASSVASENGSLFDANLSSIDASHSTVDDVSLPSFDQSL